MNLRRYPALERKAYNPCLDGVFRISLRRFRMLVVQAFQELAPLLEDGAAKSTTLFLKSCCSIPLAMCPWSRQIGRLAKICTMQMVGGRALGMALARRLWIQRLGTLGRWRVGWRWFSDRVLESLSSRRHGIPRVELWLR